MKRIFALLVVLYPCFALAQQTDQTLDPLVVTANKLDQKASETGKVVSVITRGELEHAAGKNISQLLNEQPGITVNGSGQTAGTVQSLYVRGADPQYTLVLLNGTPVSDASYIVDHFDLNLIPLSSIERIEIIRGGYASLYGSGAASAVINIITRKGDTRPLNVHATLSGGSYGTFKEQAAVNGKDGKTDYNLMLQHIDSRGFSSALDASGTAHFDRDGFNRKFIMGDIGFHPGISWTLRPYFRFSSERGDMDAGAFQDDKDYSYRSRFFQTGLDVSHPFSTGDLTIKYSYAPTIRHYENDSLDGSGYLKQPFSSYLHTADVYAHFKLTPAMSLLLGSSLEIQKSTQSTLSIYGGYKTFSEMSGDSANTTALNVYASYLFHTHNGFHLELSGRLNEHKVYGLHPVFSVNPSWLIAERFKVFANFSSSYNAPSLYQLYAPGYGNAGLKPETGLNLEGGIEGFFYDKRLRLSATGFSREQKNVIAFQILDPTTYESRYINYNHQRIYGGEAEANFRISDKIIAKAYYAYVSGRVTAKNDNTGKDSTYNNLFKKPAHSAGASVGFQVLPSLYISLDGKYTGISRDLVGYPGVATELKAYFLLNSYIQYIWKDRYKAFIGLYNITDSRYTEITGYETKRFNFEAGVAWSLF